LFGLAFTALQIVTVGAQTGDPEMAPMGAPDTAPMGAPDMVPMGDTANAPTVGLGQRIKNLFGIDAKDAAPPTGAPDMAPTGAPDTAPMGDPSCAPLANGTLPPHCK
jgi:hypothetical protein